MPDAGSPFTDLSRPPLREAGLRRALLRPGALWTSLRVVPRTASTNADLAEAARAGGAEGEVLVAEHQTAGRGRLARGWESPPRAGLTFSMLLRPAAPVAARGWPAISSSRYGWLPLLAGVALTEAVRRVARLDAVLKWPNDLLLGGPSEPTPAGGPSEAAPTGGPSGTAPAGGPSGVAPVRPSEAVPLRKGAGILAEAAGGAVVVGIGLNVTLRADELPDPGATSLQLAGAASTDRDPLLRAVLREFADTYGDWRAAGGDPEASGLRQDYLECCGTLGRPVRAELPGGESLVGEAVDVDSEGRLVISHGGALTAIAAADVVHLR